MCPNNRGQEKEGKHKTGKPPYLQPGRTCPSVYYTTRCFRTVRRSTKGFEPRRQLEPKLRVSRRVVDMHPTYACTIFETTNYRSGTKQHLRSLSLKLPFRFKILHPAHKRVSRVVGLGRSGSFRVALGS